METLLQTLKAIAIWPDQTQQITIETIKGFDGRIPNKPFCINSGTVLTGLCIMGGLLTMTIITSTEGVVY